MEIVKVSAKVGFQLETLMNKECTPHQQGRWQIGCWHIGRSLHFQFSSGNAASYTRL